MALAAATTTIPLTAASTSQVAGIIPGVHGASPREGALVVGLASLGVTWTAALGAVALPVWAAPAWAVDDGATYRAAADSRSTITTRSFQLRFAAVSRAKLQSG